MFPATTSFAVQCLTLCSWLAIGGCAQAIEPVDRDEDNGPQDTSGGTGAASDGGASVGGSGGSSLSTGGSSGKGGTTGSAGAAAKGGATGSSGATAKGGATGSSGATAKGGAIGSGGATAKGGSTAKGGAPGTGGGSTGKAGEQIFFDDFEDSNADGWIPADAEGTWSVATQDTGLAYIVAASSKTMSVGGDSAWTDQFVEARVKVVSSDGSPVVRLMGRWQALKSYLVLEFRPGDAESPEADMKLRRTLNGSTTDLCRFKPSSAIASEWNTIGFSVKGGVAALYFDGKPVVADKECMAGTDPGSGGIALGMEAGTAAFDDVRVTVPQ